MDININTHELNVLLNKHLDDRNYNCYCRKTQRDGMSLSKKDSDEYKRYALIEKKYDDLYKYHNSRIRYLRKCLR